MAQYGPIAFTGPIEVQAICHGVGGTTYSPSVILDPACTLTVTTVPSATSVVAGSTVTFTTTVINNSSTPVAGVTIADTLHVSYSPAGPYSLIAGQSVTVTGHYTATTTGTITNQATATSPTISGASPTVTVAVTSAATCAVTHQPSSVTGLPGAPVPANFGGTASGPIKWQTGPTSAGPWTDTPSIPTSVPTSNSSWWRLCCTATPGVCSNPVTITVTSVPSSATIWRTSGPQILQPCGNALRGAGINGTVNVLAGPYVFGGFDGGGSCNGAYDTASARAAGCLYTGGGVNSAGASNSKGETPLVWDPTVGQMVSLEDRYYALNGTVTTFAASRGVTAPPDHWHQRVLRMNMVCEGSGANPTTQYTLDKVLPSIQEAIDAGMVVIPEVHNLTGKNQGPGGAAYNAPISSLPTTNDFDCAVQYMDGIVTAFKSNTAGTGPGSAAANHGAVWLGDFNEPWTGASRPSGCPEAAYFAFHTWVIKRIRLMHGAENVIVVNLDTWSQDLAGLASGCYDTWWNTLKTDPSGDLTRNVVMSWHAYGANTAASGYTYAAMDGHLDKVLRSGTPGGVKYPLIIGEFGQARAPGTGNAGPDQYNRDAFTFLMTNNAGPALALKYPETVPIVWNFTGDSGFWELYALCQGPDGPTGASGLAYPPWRITSGTDPKLTAMGTAHWSISHQLWNLQTSCP